MDSSVRLLWVPRTILTALLCILITVPVVRAANLTTFEDYAVMDSEGHARVVSYAVGKVYKRALERGNHERALCLKKIFLVGDQKQVALEYARLRGRIANAIENPHPKGRVEYLVAHHAMEVCPLERTDKK